MIRFDVAIIGGGHAGIEAAWAVSQFKDLSVGLITLAGIPLAEAPCNPAIGGVGKGQVVREIDALGGIMSKVADLTAIHCRVLNESKGPAVQSTRVQIDKKLYSKVAEQLLATRSNIAIVRAKVSSIVKSDTGFILKFEDSRMSFAKKVIVTAGTFLSGKTHIGEVQAKGGRLGEVSSGSLESFIPSATFKTMRFKTGTPPRLYMDSINLDLLIRQNSHEHSVNFHWEHKEKQRHLPQVSCYIAHTNESMMSTIRKNKSRSPIFNGQVKGVGPRYCPSIEDKAFRYPDRNNHHVFIEPETLDLQTIYPSGLSTSLPKEVQESFIRLILGLEAAKFYEYGYAVEYDVIDTTLLNFKLEAIDFSGLYFAGQINGTSGYEEAAGQGLVAGLNSALSILNKRPFSIDRSDSYIGVMIEDLVSSTRDEPYRLFTARSENRLWIREDNTINRMAPYRKELGLSMAIDAFNLKYMDEYDLLMEISKSFVIRSTQENINMFKGLGFGKLDSNIFLSELLKRSHLDPNKTLSDYLKINGLIFSFRVIRAVAISIKYEGYLIRQKAITGKFQKLERRSIDWTVICESKNISYECRQRIKNVRPDTFSQLKNITGIRPATLSIVASEL